MCYRKFGSFVIQPTLLCCLGLRCLPLFEIRQPVLYSLNPQIQSGDNSLMLTISCVRSSRPFPELSEQPGFDFFRMSATP